jgi:hypothetical protein
MKSIELSIARLVPIVVLLLVTFQLTKAQEVEEKAVLVTIMVKEDAKTSFPIPFLPIFSLDGNVHSITDSLGNSFLTKGESYRIQSNFYQDSTFQITADSKQQILLSLQDIYLEAVEFKSFRTANDHILFLSKSFSKSYEKKAYLAEFSGYSAVMQNGRYLDFYQADGLSLISASSKWKPYEFVQAGWAGGKSYHYIAPLEIRRSYHWATVGGDTIPSTVSENQNNPDAAYKLSPFYFREIYSALENSWPLNPDLIKYYEFKYGEIDGREVIFFSTKEKERSNPKTNLFLIGEGVIELTNGGQVVSSITFDFSRYYYISFPNTREPRKRELAGSLAVKFELAGEQTFPHQFDLKAKFFGPRNLFKPRPFKQGEESTILERGRLGNFQFVKSKSDLENLEKGMSFAGLGSPVKFDLSYWSNQSLIESELFDIIAKDVGNKIPLERQFRANSEKGMYPSSEYSFAYLRKLYPQASTNEEAAKLYRESISTIVSQLKDIRDNLGKN